MMAVIAVARNIRSNAPAWQRSAIPCNARLTPEIDYVTSATGATPPVTNSLINLSQNAWNATLYYEGGGWSLRSSASPVHRHDDESQRGVHAHGPAGFRRCTLQILISKSLM
jgi:hypothetical protein